MGLTSGVLFTGPPVWTALQDNIVFLFLCSLCTQKIRFLLSSHLIWAPILTRGPDTLSHHLWAYLVAQVVKIRPTMQETWVQSLGWEDALEEGMATHSSILAWRIPWTEEPGGVQSITSFISPLYGKQMEFIWITPERCITSSLPSIFFFFLMQNLNTVLWKSTRKGEMGPDEGALFPSGTQRQLLFLKKYIFCLFIYLSMPGSSYAIPNTEKVERLWGQHYTSLKNRQRSWHPVPSLHGK